MYNSAQQSCDGYTKWIQYEVISRTKDSTVDSEQRDGQWVTTIEVGARNLTELKKRVAAVKRLLTRLDKEKPKPRRRNGEGTIFTREEDGMKVARIDLPRGPDGKRRRSKPVYAKDIATLVEKLDKLKSDAAQGVEQIDRRMTVAAWLDKWSADIAPNKMKPHPLRSARSAINTRIKPAIGHLAVSALKPEHIRYMHNWILAATYTRGRDPETNEPIEIPYTTRSVEEAHNVLSGALEDAVNEGIARRNVCSAATKPQVLSESHGALTSEQARAVLIAAQEANDPLVTRWAAGLMLGGRQGELLGLQWDRVDFERGSLDLAWQLEWLPLKDGADPDDPNRFEVQPGFEHIPLWRGAALDRPKSTKSQRVIPLPAPLAAILLVHRQQWEPNPWNLVWVSGRGKPIGDSVDLKGWAEAQKRAGINKRVDVHAMRGTTATLLLEAGVDAKIIQSIMGHSSVITTRGYQQVDLSLAHKAVGNLHPLLELSTEPKPDRD